MARMERKGLASAMASAEMGLRLLDGRAERHRKRVLGAAGGATDSAKKEIAREIRFIGEGGRKALGGKLDAQPVFERGVEGKLERHIRMSWGNYRENSNLLKMELVRNRTRRIYSWAAGLAGSAFFASIPLSNNWGRATAREWMVCALGIVASVGAFFILRKRAIKSCANIIKQAQEGSNTLSMRVKETKEIVIREKERVLNQVRETASNRGSGAEEPGNGSGK